MAMIEYSLGFVVPASLFVSFSAVSLLFMLLNIITSKDLRLTTCRADTTLIGSELLADFAFCCRILRLTPVHSSGHSCIAWRKRCALLTLKGGDGLTHMQLVKSSDVLRSTISNSIAHRVATVSTPIVSLLASSIQDWSLTSCF
eukprot:TRINITY_DN87703_c0_g1_i1.p1 TRINITY_DN87703_c0_g1~~TRINITY_DN87703_c0_g1_i1.p1  ORF type:complete len:166 (-),score=23.71 TRINITY_DN87703_c0_g1_i1:53-484(-)